MSMFNNIKKFFFEEGDSDVLVDDEIKNVDFKEDVLREYNPVIKKEETPNLTATKPIEIKKTEPKKEETKKFISIDLDEGPKKQVEKEPIVQRKISRMEPIKNEERNDFEFTPVISPIFGAKEEVVVKTSKGSKPSVQIHHAKKKANPLGTIISPYYGIGELEEFEAEAQMNIEKKEQLRKNEIQEKHLEKLETIKREEKEELKSISLEEILRMDTKDNDGEDLHQISLFGDTTPVKEAKATAEVEDIENL